MPVPTPLRRLRAAIRPGLPALPALPARLVRAAVPARIARAVPLVLALPALLLPGPVRADLDAEGRSRADRLAALFEAHNRTTSFELPTLEDEHWEELFEGDVVRRMDQVPMEDVDGESRQHRRIWAFRIVDRDRAGTWLAALHPEFVASDRVTEVRLDSDGAGGSTWYQYIGLPWPVRDRHWVIRVTTEVEVAAASDGRAWEQTWDLVPGGPEIALEVVGRGDAEGIDLDDARGARYLEANTGAWTMFDLGVEGTLVAYQLTLVLGGWIPDALAARFAKKELRSLLDTVAENVDRVVEIYDPEVEPILGGDGRLLLREDLRPAGETRAAKD